MLWGIARTRHSLFPYAFLSISVQYICIYALISKAIGETGEIDQKLLLRADFSFTICIAVSRIRSPRVDPTVKVPRE